MSIGETDGMGSRKSSEVLANATPSETREGFIGHTPGYRITKDGRVFSVTSNWRGYGEREMCQIPNDDGYPAARLTTNGKRVQIAVHRLVARDFLPRRPSPQHEIRHLDGNKTNSHFTNLAWGTRK